MLLVMLEWSRQLQDVERPREGRTNISIEKEDRWEARQPSVLEVVVHLGGRPNAFEIETMDDFFFGKPEVVLYVGKALAGTPTSSQYPRRNAAYRRCAKRYPRVYSYRIVSPSYMPYQRKFLFIVELIKALANHLLPSDLTA